MNRFQIFILARVQGNISCLLDKVKLNNVPIRRSYETPRLWSTCRRTDLSQDISYKKFLLYHRGKSIVSDGPSPPSVQPPEEEELFPTPFPHIPVGGRLAH
jgi:hypothetical protein